MHVILQYLQWGSFTNEFAVLGPAPTPAGKMDVPIGGLLLLSYPLDMHSPVIRQKFTPFVGLENKMFETINQVYPLVI